MVKESIKKIKVQLRPELKKAGFKVKGGQYVRVTPGKVLQCFSFQRFSDGTKFTVNIGITPLYEEGCRWFIEPMRLGQIIGEGDRWWSGSEEAVSEVVSLISNEQIDEKSHSVQAGMLWLFC